MARPRPTVGTPRNETLPETAARVPARRVKALAPRANAKLPDAQRVFAARLRRLFAELREGLIPRILNAYPEPVEKAAAARRMSAREIDAIDAAIARYGRWETAWDEIVGEVEVGLATVGGAAATDAMAQLGINNEEMIGVVNARVAEYARERSAELVGKRILADGTLIDNPSREWAIDETTRRFIRGDVISAFDEGLTRRELSALLRESYAFSDYRADMIAQTELSFANAEASLQTWQASGVVSRKVWLYSDDEGVCEECLANAAQGAIGLDEVFASGDESYPAHPNCRCDVAAVVDEELLETLAPEYSAGLGEPVEGESG